MQVFHQKGYLFLHKDKNKWEHAQQAAEKQQDWGLKDVRILSSEDINKEFPFTLNGGILGGTFCPTDGFLDPGIILTNLKGWLLDNKVTIRNCAEVQDFSTRGNKVKSIKLKGEEIIADFFVNCTGAWAHKISAMLETEIPIKPEKRYLYIARFASQEEDFSSRDFARVPMIVCMGNPLVPYLKPEPGANPHSFMLGCEHEAHGEYDFKDEDQAKVEPRFMANKIDGHHLTAWQEIATWIPFTEKLGFLDKVNGGYYATTPDHNAFIDFDPEHQNVIHCAGFSGHGLMHGPASGRIVADLIAHGEFRTLPSCQASLSFKGFMDGQRETENMKI